MWKAGGTILISTTPVRWRRRADARAPSASRAARGTGCDTLVSSISSTRYRLLHPGSAEAPGGALPRLRDLALVFLIVKRDRLLQDHWIFFPERRYPFNRLFEQKAMDQTMGPPGRTALCCDLTCDAGDPTWNAPDEELVKRCFDSLVQAELLGPDELETGFVRRFRSFYPMYTVDYRQRLGAVYERLRVAENLVPTGRLGMFNYNNSDHCLDMGRFIARDCAESIRRAEIWDGLEERVRSVPDHRLSPA
jgi:protoporphyrinogen oxidase